MVPTRNEMYRQGILKMYLDENYAWLLPDMVCIRVKKKLRKNWLLRRDVLVRDQNKMFSTSF